MRYLTQFLNYTVPGGMVLFVVFVILRLLHIIMWSWWWVCSPIYLPLAVMFAASIWVYFKADDYLPK